MVTKSSKCAYLYQRLLAVGAATAPHLLAVSCQRASLEQGLRLHVCDALHDQSYQTWAAGSKHEVCPGTSSRPCQLGYSPCMHAGCCQASHQGRCVPPVQLVLTRRWLTQRPEAAHARACMQDAAKPATKAIVFSQFWMHIELVVHFLSSRGVPLALLKRSLSPAEKAAALASFQVVP